MAEFPASPIPANEFMERWLPKAFADAVPDDARNVDVRFGVKLEGAGGGEWVLHIDHGKLSVAAEPRDECPFTLVQSVDNWRGTLWEGKGGAFGQQAAAMFKPGAQAAAGNRPGGGGGMNPAALEAMRALNGVIRMKVLGGGGGDWEVDFKLGPGAIPAEPTTTVSITSADAEAMASGQLDPMQAFMSGKIQVAGDMGLMMQMQMIQMQAAAAAPKA